MTNDYRDADRAEGPRTILIDGYNVIRRTPSLAAVERVSLEAGRAALLAQVISRYRPTPHTVIVVFDGDGETERSEPIARRTRGRVIFTRRAETADEVLGRIAAEERSRGAELVVATDDGEVRRAVTGVGGEVASVEDLQRRLNAPPKHLARQARHRAYLRAKWARESEG
jgi:predicted RNA-binding protein with PIN domain